MHKLQRSLIVLAFMYSVQVTAIEDTYQHFKPIITYLRTSDFLGDDLKAACEKHCEFFYQIALELPALLYYASQRPNVEVTSEVYARLSKGESIRGADVLIATNCGLCYGEAVCQDNKLYELSSEPTRKNRPYYSLYLRTSFDPPEFESSLAIIKSQIQKVGELEQWDNEKKEGAVSHVLQKCLLILQNPSYEPIILATSLFDHSKKAFNAQIEISATILEQESKITEELGAEIASLKRQISSMNKQIAAITKQS